MKHLIIVNSKAGAEKDVEAFKKLVEESFKGLNYEIYMTTGPRSVIPFLKEYLSKNNDVLRVYACGGDGTIHEVVNAIAGFHNVELAVYASGTGNDFVKIYAKTNDYDEIVKNKAGENRFKDFKALIDGKVQEIDISKMTGPSLSEPWYSINVINFGFDAIVGAKGNENKKKGIKNPYGPAAIIPAILGGRFNKIMIKCDGEPLNKKRLLNGALGQGQWVGAQYHASPKSDNTDGLIDVSMLKCMSLARLMIQFFGPYTKGQHLDSPKLMKKINYKRAKVVDIISLNNKDIDISVDGEIVSGKEFRVECMPKAIKFVVPNN